MSKPWIAAWAGGALIGIVNGTIRELVYKERVGELTAHQISTAAAIALFGAYFALLQRRWPIATEREALEIGGAWLALTIVFEFGFGHAIDGRSWGQLLHDYDLAHGRVWALVLVWLAVGPETVRRLSGR